MYCLLGIRYLFIVAASLSIVTPLHAADYYWNGTPEADWSTLNWTDSGGSPLGTSPGGWDSIYNTNGGNVILTDARSPGYFKFATGNLIIQAGGSFNSIAFGGSSMGSGSAMIIIDGGTLSATGSIGVQGGGGI